MKYHISCRFCKSPIEIVVIHNGFNDSIHAYCDNSAHVAILDFSERRLKELLENMDDNWHSEPAALAELEKHLQSCSCGGSYSFSAPLRCPHCNQIFGVEEFGELIDPDKKWWDRKWHTNYAFVLNGLLVKNNWK